MVQQAGQAQILQGDALEVLRTLPAESVQCVVTSPPYFGLRDYGTAEWDGGETDCDHRSPTMREGRNENRAKLAGSEATNSAQLLLAARTGCGKCGATRIDRQIGLESTPAEYVAKMVDVFREVRRVLRKDGVCWLNIGDSYAGGTGGYGPASTLSGYTSEETKHRKAYDNVIIRKPSNGLKPKDLIGVPWRLAFALQADGWYLRQDIIWAKPNPMPESVTDRCTKAHEYVFLLSKSERYFYDANAISEQVTDSPIERLTQPNLDNQVGSFRVPGKTNGPMKAVGSAHMQGTPRNDGDRWRMADGGVAERGTRNKRSVWTITTEPYPEAHFATFPTELPRICILAGSKIGDTILDPFAGSGTTLQVALELSRAAIGIELNEEYVALANRRLNSTTLGLPLEIAE